MDDEKINLLVPEDGLNPENGAVQNNNLDLQYTEELDFSNLEEELNKARLEKPIIENEPTSVPLEPIYEESISQSEPVSVPLEPIYEESVSQSEPVSVPLEPVYEESVSQSKPVSVPLEPVYEEKNENVELNEHPSAQIKLNKDVEETKEEVETIKPGEIKDSIFGNKSLLYVLALGFLLLIVIFVLPYLI